MHGWGCTDMYGCVGYIRRVNRNGVNQDGTLLHRMAGCRFGYQGGRFTGDGARVREMVRCRIGVVGIWWCANGLRGCGRAEVVHAGDGTE